MAESVSYSGSHGKVYPWASPVGTPLEIRTKVLGALQDRLDEFLETLLLEKKTQDSGSDLDSSGDERPRDLGWLVTLEDLPRVQDPSL